MTLPTQIAEGLAALGARVDEVEERFVRGSGPGGQKINKTSSTVWLRHRPTGVEVRCQRERSQTANRQTAGTFLVANVVARALKQSADEFQAPEAQPRRIRQKSRGQKQKMVATKELKARIKARRQRV